MPIKKIMLVFGTRPEAIKMAPLFLELKKAPNFKVEVLVTGQHRHMLDQVLGLFKIKPDFDLNIMESNQDLSDITSKVLLGCRNIFKESKPDLVLVHGDTTTSTAAALAAFYLQIDVGHVEAGLRTFNKYSPFPEELNRQITSRIARFHFCPTELSKQNLLKEMINPEDVTVTGNTGIDALLHCSKMLEGRTNLECPYNPINDRRYVLITGHRRENFGEGFVSICRAISQLAQKFQDVDFVYPVHLNPNVRAPVTEHLGNQKNIFLIEPLEYMPFVYLMKSAYFILTDSGGIQEEVPSLKKPLLVMREITERPEAVEAGIVKLVGTSEEIIVEEASKLLTNKDAYQKMISNENPYGDGRAASKIYNFIQEKLNK